MSIIANSLSEAEINEYSRHSENIIRMATLLNNTDTAKKYFFDKGIDAEKLNQEEIIRQVLSKDLLNQDLPDGYLSTSEELAAKQLSKRAVDSSFLEVPDFKPTRLSNEMSFKDDIDSGRSSVELTEAFKDVNFGKTLGFVARQSLGYGLATMTGGMSVALVSNPIVSYAIFSAVKFSVFKALEFSGVLTSLRKAFSGFLSKVTETLGFDKFSDKNPVLANGAKLLAIGTAVTAAVIAFSSDANAEVSLKSPNVENKSLQALNAFEIGIEKSEYDPVTNLSGAAKHLAEAADAPKNLVQVLQSEVTEKLSDSLEVNTHEVVGNGIQDGVSGQTGVEATKINDGSNGKIPNHLTGNFSNDLNDYSLSSRLDSIRENTQVGQTFAKLDQEPISNTINITVPFKADSEVILSEMEQGENTSQVSNLTNGVAPFDISTTESIQMEIKSGSSVWRTYENYLEGTGIQFENDAQKNKVMVHIMQEIARINPDIESIHKVQAGQALTFPKVETLEQALSATQTIEVTGETNVLANHAPSEGMISEGKSKSVQVNDFVNSHVSDASIQQVQAVESTIFRGEVEWAFVDRDGYAGLTGDSGKSLLFEDSPQEMIRTMAETIADKLYNSDDYNLVEKDFVTRKIEAEILNQNSLLETDKGFIKVPTNLNEMHFAEIASGVNEQYIGEYVIENAQTYTESNYQMDSKGEVHMATDKSIEQVSATIALEMSKREGMTTEQIGKLYGEIVESIKLENGVHKNDAPLDKFRVPQDLQSEIKNERLLKYTNVYKPHELPKFR